jgi:hypothetical protein
MKVALGAGASRQPRKNWGTSKEEDVLKPVPEFDILGTFLKAKKGGKC